MPNRGNLCFWIASALPCSDKKGDSPPPICAFCADSELCNFCPNQIRAFISRIIIKDIDFCIWQNCTHFINDGDNTSLFIVAGDKDGDIWGDLIYKKAFLNLFGVILGRI